MPLPAAAGLALNEAERNQLKAIRRHRSTPRGIVLRINIVLGAADGIANRVLARRLSTSVPTVLLWRKRYASEGLSGILENRPRTGRPKGISEERETAIVGATDEDHSSGRHAMERTRDGGRSEGQFRNGATDLEET